MLHAFASFACGALESFQPLVLQPLKKVRAYHVVGKLAEKQRGSLDRQSETAQQEHDFLGGFAFGWAAEHSAWLVTFDKSERIGFSHFVHRQKRPVLMPGKEIVLS